MQDSFASDDLVVKLTNLNGDWEHGVVPADPNGVVSGEFGGCYGRPEKTMV